MGFWNLLFGKNQSYIRSGISSQDKLIVQQKWLEISELVKLGGPSRYRSAVVEADKLLGFVLEKMGYQGSLGDRLKAAKEKFVENHDFSLYNEIWQAHSCRNKIVHEVNYEFLSHEAHDAIRKFEKAFKKLGVI